MECRLGSFHVPHHDPVCEGTSSAAAGSSNAACNKELWMSICPLLGRTERVTAPTAPLPTAMESADGAPGDRSLNRGTSLSGVYAGTHAMCIPRKGGAPILRWMSRAGLIARASRLSHLQQFENQYSTVTVLQFAVCPLYQNTCATAGTEAHLSRCGARSNRLTRATEMAAWEALEHVALLRRASTKALTRDSSTGRKQLPIARVRLGRMRRLCKASNMRRMLGGFCSNSQALRIIFNTRDL
jgi:hypothetical protein